MVITPGDIAAPAQHHAKSDAGEEDQGGKQQKGCDNDKDEGPVGVWGVGGWRHLVVVEVGPQQEVIFLEGDGWKRCAAGYEFSC